nr:replicase polyprotein [Grapevine Red Globe virus]
MASFTKLAITFPASSVPYSKEFPNHSFWAIPGSNDFTPYPTMTPTNFPHLFLRIPTQLERSIPIRDLLGDFRPSRRIRPDLSTPSKSRLILTGAAPTPSPFKGLLEALAPTIHKDTIAAPIAEAAARPFRSAMTMFPWAMSPEHRDFLRQCGITVPDLSTKSHPHPVHKTIETNLLHNVWHHYATSPSAVLFMKPSKFDKLAKANPNFTELHNYHVVPKDITRYPTTSHEFPTTPTVFMHDALMYFSPSQILGLFLECPTLTNLYASLVVPPESDFTDLSLHPTLYKMIFQGDQLVYHLEDNPAHSYTQPLSALNWLKYTQITDGQLTLFVSILDSWGPVHSLLITRTPTPEAPKKDSVSFKVPSAILLPAPESLRQDVRHRLVPKTVYQNLFAYTRAVRTLRVTDPAGYIRTQSQKPEYDWVTSAAWDNLQNFSLQTAPHRPIAHYFLFRSPLARLRHWIRTNDYYLQLTASAIAAPVASTLTFFAFRLHTRKIEALSIFHHWFKAPTHLLFKPKAPLFCLTTVEDRPELFTPLLRGLRDSLPWNRFLFPARRLPSLTTPAILLAASIPLAYMAYRWFVGPDPPQQLHDAYHQYFHSKEWNLTFQRQPHHCAPSPPLHLIRSSAQPESDSSFRPIIPEDLPTDPEPVPILPPPLPPVGPMLIPFPRESEDELDRPAPPAVSPPPVPSAPTPKVTRSAPPAYPPTPMNRIDPPTLKTQADPVPSAPAPNPTKKAMSLRPNAPSFALPIPSETRTYIEALSSSSGGIAPDTPATNQLVPEAPVAPELDSPLLSDPTGHGPAKPWSAIFPRDYASDCGSFLTRERNGPHSSQPYPAARDCLLVAVSKALDIPTQTLWNSLCQHLPDIHLTPETTKLGLTTDHLTVLATIYNFLARVEHANGVLDIGIIGSPTIFTIKHTEGNPGHFEYSPAPPPLALAGSRHSDLEAYLLSFRLDGHLLPIQKIHKYRSHLSRAKNLISNMKNGFDGIMANVNPHHPSQAREHFLALDSQMDIATARTVSLVHIAGFAGCGKSYPVQQMLQRTIFSHYKVALPTTELRAEWKRNLKIKNSDNWRISTWESSLLKRARVLVIDEIYKMPRGYLDLAIQSDPTAELVIILGDPIQGEYHSTHPSSTNAHLTSEVTHLRPYIDMYCLWSRRIPKDMAAFFNVPSLSEEPGHNGFRLKIPQFHPILANATSQAKTLAQLGYHAITIASSQGTTFRSPVVVHLDRNSSQLSMSHSLVALTRSTAGTIFTGDNSMLQGSSGNTMFSLYHAGKSIDLLTLFPKQLTGLPLIRAPISKRKTVLAGALPSHASLPALPAPPSVLTRFQGIKPHHCGDVFFNAPVVIGDGLDHSARISTHFLPETRRPLHFDLPTALPSAIAPSAVAITSSASEPVYPGEHFETLASNFLEVIDPDSKEKIIKGTRSNQFPWVNNDFVLGSQTSTIIAPIHNSKNDPTLLPGSIAKRLRFRSSTSPYQISPADELLGNLLYSAWCDAMQYNPDAIVPFDEALFIECINVNEFAQLTSKTQSVILANAYRSDPDWRWSVVRIFTKTQHKVNEASIFSDWKACQTLALAHDAVILLLGPVKKYQRCFDNKARPAKIYYHASHTPFELSQWCQANMKHQHHLTNDYTAYDQSQGGEAVVLERLKMLRVSIPQPLIDLHVHLKTNVDTQLGPLTSMRLTGEPGTYDDNSDYNLAVTASKFILDPEIHSVLISGDDLDISPPPPLRPTWPILEEMLSLRFKTEVSRYGLFCGYYLGPAGAVRSPLALFAKLIIAVDDGSIEDKKASYLSEFAVGHSLGQDMWTLLPENQVPYQSANFDFFCRHCPPSWKLALRIGSPDLSFLDSLNLATTHLTSATFAMLSFAARRLYKAFRPEKHFVSEVSANLPHNTELLPDFNSSIAHLSDIVPEPLEHPLAHIDPASIPLDTLSIFRAADGISPLTRPSPLRASLQDQCFPFRGSCAPAFGLGCSAWRPL